MVFHNELSMMDSGTIGQAAFAAWMQETLSQQFDPVLHEPLPPALQAILGGRTEADAALIPAQENPGRAKS